jgi:error-prone DNA polymerase
MITAEIPAFAAERSYAAALLADPFSLTGAVEFCDIANGCGIRPLVGATFEMPEGGELVLVARSKIGYRSLSRLITECHLGEPRLFPLCTWERLERHAQDLICLTGGDDGPLNRLLIRRDFDGARKMLERLAWLYGRVNVFVQIERSFLPWQIAVNRSLLKMADDLHFTAVAGGPIHYEQPGHFPVHDVLVCVETLCLIDEVEGRKPARDPSQPQAPRPPRRGLNAERYFRLVEEMEELYADRPDLLDNGWRIVERCESNVLPDRTVLPRVCDDENGLLRKLMLHGAEQRFKPMEEGLSRRIGDEFNRITRLGYARHFLVAWDMCNWAEEQGIVYSGRGSVVDSLVAYCLGMTRIDPWRFRLHFDRFLPNDAQKRPDIDIDFEARRRDDVRQYLVEKYGDAHVATVGAVGTYRSRGIIREVGKVMGIPEEMISLLAKRLHGGVSAHRLEQALVDRPELRDSNIPKERFRWVFQFAEQLMDLPRNLRSHSSGVVISSEPICDTVPVTWSGVDGVKIMQWDKRSAKRCFDKFDILCLRGNDVLGDTQRSVSTSVPGFSVTNLSLDDDETYRAMRTGQLIGIPQSASPAMRQAHIRIRTENLKDAGIVQAAIRPGVGGAVKINEFVARRRGKKYRLLHKDMEDILDHTLGIVVFQEQIDQLLQTFGRYTSDEAELLREGIYKNRRAGFAESIREQVVAKIIGNGYTRAVALEVFELVAGFQGYGFAEGHALAFAEISIRSIYCQQNYPAEYFAAILDAQPAGYYGPATLANEARIRNVKVLPPDVNRSKLTFAVESVKSDEDPQLVFPNGGIRTSLRQIGGISEEMRQRFLEVRGEGAFLSFFDFVARVGPDRDELEKLILCGVFDSFHPNRRALLWAIPRAMEYGALVRSMEGALPLFLEDPELPIGVDDFSPEEKAIYERAILGMDVERHLMAFERPRVEAKGGVTAADAGRLPSGTKAFVVGNPIRLRFPPTSSGKRVMFFDLEDETGLLNVTCFDDVYQRDGHKVICNPYVTLWGESQDRDGHIAFLAHRIYPYRPELKRHHHDYEPLPIVTADFLVG